MWWRLAFGLAAFSLAAALLVSIFAIDWNSFILRHTRFKDGKPPGDYVYIPQQLASNPTLSHLDAVIVGGSSAREFFPDQTEISEGLSRLCGTAVRALNAATSSQGLADSAAMVDAVYAAGSTPKLIVVGLTHYRVAQNWESWGDVLAEQRVTLPVSPTLLMGLPLIERLSWYLGDKPRQLSRLSDFLKGSEFLWDPPPPRFFSQHHYNVDPMVIHRKREKSFVSGIATAQYLERDPSFASEMFKEVFDRFRARGADVVYIFTPMAPIAAMVQSAQEPQIGIVKALLAQDDVVLDLRRSTGLSENVFYDDQHLRPEGRAQYWGTAAETSALSSKICPSLM